MMNGIDPRHRKLSLRSTVDWTVLFGVGFSRQAAARAWRWRWLLLMNVYLVSPLLLYESGIASTRSYPDKILLFALPASILWLLLIQRLFRQLWRAHALLFPLYIAVGIDLYLIISYQTRLTSSTIAMFLDNLDNAADYGITQLTQISLSALALVAFYSVGMFKIRSLTINPKRKGVVAALAGLLALYGTVTAKQVRSGFGVQQSAMDVISHDRNSPFGIFPQTYIAWQSAKESFEHRRLSASFRFGARSNASSDPSEVYVLVIGESSRPDHWGLYGYHRDTTPGLRREKKLIAFKDAVAQAALTQISVPSIITRCSVIDGARCVSERSLVSLFKEAGFTTYWLSTQQRDQWTGAVNRYMAEADFQYSYERQHDRVLVDMVEKVVAEPKTANRRLFFVLHTQGSHFVFADRYPESFQVFPESGPGLTDREKMANTYDNTIRYTDDILSRLIAILKENNSPSAMLYVADHAENLRDDQRNLFGHFLNNEYDLPIPMVIWYSHQTEMRYPDKIRAALHNAARPLNTSAVLYTLADIAGIQFPDANFPYRSLVSPRFTSPRRWVMKMGGGLVDFDRNFRGLRPQRQPVTGNVERLHKPIVATAAIK
jgi:glucan phosphoethanolaminetransferase (alkaline phosphatase superfamily)